MLQCEFNVEYGCKPYQHIMADVVSIGCTPLEAREIGVVNPGQPAEVTHGPPPVRGEVDEPRSNGQLSHVLQVLAMSVKVAEFTAQEALMQGERPRFNPSMLPRIRDLGLKGRSRHQIAMELGVSEKTLGNWEKAHPDLKDMMDFAYTAAQAFYETMVDAAIFDPAFQSNVYKLIMESRFSDTYSPRKGADKIAPDEGLSYEDKIKLIETQVRRYSKEPE